MTDLDYAIQRMQDAIRDLDPDSPDNDETLREIQGGLDDAFAALGITQNY